eukprot:CAMPEP_0174818544 /NCGR_PEP_ID=MMETSP1107-20130205/1263_1 /TAXON_ID=36770 /ORGANISM="Paraphysomonas vestita, Strain GFlagA" /LENGTH=852 /DNA_ID=CAMNT_0016030539 /DNA_START=307 /DNA_END=2865 /DNA_ORIENTATION=-
MPSEEDCPGESFHSGDITNLFQTIPSNSWILPYILVGAVTLAKENENKETLCAHSDVRLKSRVLNDVQVTADSTTSSNNHTPTPNSPAIISDIDNEPELSDDNYGDCDDDELDAVCHDHEVKHKHHNKHHHNNNNNQEHEHEHSNEDNHHDEYHHSEEPHTQKKKKHHGIKSLFHRKKKHHDEINEDHGSDDQGHRHHSEDHSHKDKEKHKHHGIGHFFHRKHKHHSDHIEGGSGHGSGNDSNDPHNSNSATPNNETDSDHVNEDQTRHKSHSTASIFNSLIHKKKPPKPNDINKSVHGDLVISFDDNGVYVANKPERSSSTNLENSDSEQSISNLPKFMQHLFFFPNFQKLGVVFIRRSIENTWERRNLYLWDNYLFETLVGSDDHLPLGFANLSGGSINLKFDKKSQKSLTQNQPKDSSRFLRLNFCINSTLSSRKQEVDLCGETPAVTEELRKLLFNAISLRIETNYEYDPSIPPLGVGRYAKVVRAVNKLLRTVVLKKNNSTHSFSSSNDLSQLNNNTPNSINNNNNNNNNEINQSSTHSVHSSNMIPGQVALKMVNKTEFWNQVNNGVERKDTLVREVLAQSHIVNSLIHNPEGNSAYDQQSVSEVEVPIVVLNGVLETIDEFVLDMELMHSGDLYEKLVENGTAFKEYQVKYIAVQLLQAVALCQASGIAHRDIKLSNITFPERVSSRFMNDTTKDVPLQIKLADFGMAGFVNSGGYLWGRCGTPGYVAPEIFRSGVRDGYTVNVDMFSLGVVIFTLLSGYEPFGGDNIQQIIEANKLALYDFNGAEWRGVSDDAKNFIQQALQTIPSKRLTVHDALKHPWIAEYGSMAQYPPKYAASHDKKCVIS